MLNEYAAAVGLFFFALLPDSVAQMQKDGQTNQVRHLGNTFNDPSQLYYRDRLDGILRYPRCWLAQLVCPNRYMLREPIRKPGLHMSEELRDKFLRGPELYGLDLAALIVQTGRDHGIGNYASWRNHCGLSRPQNFDDLREIVLESVDLSAISRIYSSVEDLDLFVIGLAERPAHGALVGPTFACIIAKQFEKVSSGVPICMESICQFRRGTATGFGTKISSR